MSFQTSLRPRPIFNERPKTPIVPIERVRPKTMLPPPVVTPPPPPPLPTRPITVEELISKYREVRVPDSAIPINGVSVARSILKNCADRHGVHPLDILGPLRNRVMVNARIEAVWLVHRANPHWSLPRLGRFFNKDHTTILHVMKKVKAHMSREGVLSIDALYKDGVYIWEKS